MVDELVRRFLIDFKDQEEKKIAIISVDPSVKERRVERCLGDRIRMNSAFRNDRVFMRSIGYPSERTSH